MVCAILQTFKILPCDYFRFFICKVSEQSSSQTEMCDTNNGFESFETGCYLYVDEKMNWHDVSEINKYIVLVFLISACQCPNWG